MGTTHITPGGSLLQILERITKKEKPITVKLLRTIKNKRLQVAYTHAQEVTSCMK